MKKYRAYAILIAAIVVAGVLAFVLPGENGQTAAMIAVTFAVIMTFSALVSWPPGGGFVERKPYLFKALGGILEALAVGIFAWSLVVAVSAPSSTDASSLYITAAITVMLIGVLLIIAPRTARQSREARARQEAFKAAKQKGYSEATFNGPAEGGLALASLVKDGGVFLRIVWPWFLAPLALLALALVVLSGAKQGDARPLWLLLAVVLIASVGLPTTVVAWHRWLIEKREPGWFVIPDGRAFSYLWRLWVFTSVSNRATVWAGDAVTGALKQMLPAYAPVAGTVVSDLSFALICAAASNFALGLPAIAVRDKGFPQAIALSEARRLWPGLPVGLLVSIAPFVAVEVGLDIWAQFAPKSGPGNLSWTLVVQSVSMFALLFLGWVSSASLLSRAYLVAKARLAALE